MISTLWRVIEERHRGWAAAANVWAGES